MARVLRHLHHRPIAGGKNTHHRHDAQIDREIPRHDNANHTNWLRNDAIFGAEPQKFGFVSANFESLRNAKTVRLAGDHDVFGDGSVVIKPAPGHTPGHQVLFVRLPKRGPVILSGDMVHLVYSWENRVVPSFNFDVAMSGRSIDAIKDFAKQNNAQLWVNHDKEQHATIPKAPDFVQ